MIENNKELIERFKCELCNGFIIDATTITECFHSCNKISTNKKFKKKMTRCFNLILFLNSL